MIQKSECGCSLAAPTAQSDKASASIPKPRLTIEFMYLDRTVCAPCQLTEANLEAALMEAAGSLDAIGVEVDLRKIHIQSLEQALALGFALSPTIRVNGVDIPLDSQADSCATCSKISGTPTDCRVWLYQGHAYDAPPQAMLVEALLEAARQSSQPRPARALVSDCAQANLKHFFDAQREVSAGTGRGEARLKTSVCCGPAMSDSAACCEAPIDVCCNNARG